MIHFPRNPSVCSAPLPVDFVFHPSWWNRHTGITFDEDFFFHPLKRVESERRMEEELFQRFGQFGFGENHLLDLPQIGAVHLAAGFLISEMLGCKVDYVENAAPQVHPAGLNMLSIDPETAFKSVAWKRLVSLQNDLKGKYGYLTGDINWGGVLNIAIDLAGDQILTDFFMKPEETKEQFRKVATVIERFVAAIARETGTSSISVNRNVRHIEQPVFLHSECTHTMISDAQYEEFLLPFDLEWSRKFRPFGIHYCGPDPHRHVNAMKKIKTLDFLDVGWGGDIKKLREHLPNTFLNIRLDPVTINSYSTDQIERVITRLVTDSDNPWLTGVCCINMDDRVDDAKIETICKTVNYLRKKVT